MSKIVKEKDINSGLGLLIQSTFNSTFRMFVKTDERERNGPDGYGHPKSILNHISASITDKSADCDRTAFVEREEKRLKRKQYGRKRIAANGNPIEGRGRHHYYLDYIYIFYIRMFL